MTEPWTVRASRAIEAYGRACAQVAVVCRESGPKQKLGEALKAETEAYREWFQIISEKGV